jgi:adenine-specific DNA methylase
MQDHTEHSEQDSLNREPISRKEREKRAREIKSQGGTDLFVANGFRTTLDEIACRRIRQGTIYNYFASKEELSWASSIRPWMKSRRSPPCP